MDAETGSAASSTARRPKAKARPRRETVTTGMILIRYDNPRTLRFIVENNRGKYLICGEEISETGPVSQDRVCELIGNASDHRDRCLPQRGDAPIYTFNAETGAYDNRGYTCISDGVRGGILDLMPTEGAQFIHYRWNIVPACVPRDMNYYDKQNASWALRCIQADLRHGIGRKEGTTHLDSRCTAKFEQVIPCDDGGWVKIDDLIKMEVRWTHHSRKISVNGDIRDADQQRRIYNQRLQLLFNGNLLAARQGNGKVRLQFLGVRCPSEGSS